MTLFSGSDALNIEQKALSLVKSHLEAGLAAAPHAATFAAYGGVTLLDDDTLAEDAEIGFSMRPQVFLSIDAHDRKPWGATLASVYRAGRRHEMKITAEILTSDSCYKAEPKLRDALQSLVDDGQKTLREAGFFEAMCDPNPDRTNDTNKINPLVISGALYTVR